jgi:phosphoenolpyruvate phosphomutase
LACAIADLETDTVICYGDLLFRSYVLRALVESKGEFSVVVDSSAPDTNNRTVRDFAFCSRADDRGLFGTPARLEQVVSTASTPAHGRWIGLLNVSRGGVLRLKRVLAQLQARADFDSLDMPALLNALVADGAAIDVQYVHGHWRGVNDLEDLHSAVDFAHAQAPIGTVQGGTSKTPDARGP